MSALSLLRVSLVAGCALAFASLFATSCVTPAFDFGDGPLDRDGLGGAGSQRGGGVDGHCENRRIDADETDTDCGGLDCAPCSMGRSCAIDGDCEAQSCVTGKCQAASCTDGEKNHTESDTDCGGDSCAPCPAGNRCAADADCESRVCSGSVCQEPTCEDGVKNGQEVGVDCAGKCPAKCDVGQECGRVDDCLQPPGESGVDAQCVSNLCVLGCPMGQADCNGSATDLCEINTSTSLEHCGGCGQKCDPEAAVASCSGGVCGYEKCLDDHEDVDGNRENGCEVDNQKDPLHCGPDSLECSAHNGTPSCVGGSCAIECDDGFDDCNGDVRDGCETDLSADVKNCDGCGTICPSGGASESPYCLDGECGLTDCDAGLGDCDGDQLCTDDLTSTASCGSCGTKCTVANGTPGCDGASCRIASCNQSETNSYADCDGNYVNGCEFDVLNSPARCGGCLSSDPRSGSGKNCQSAVGTKHIAAVECGAGVCKITGCAAGWADCDGSFANGCEIDLNNDDLRCGGCLPTDSNPASGTDCTKAWAQANGSCDGSGQCQFDGCKASFGDCENGINADGCETDIGSSEDHCGVCERSCDTDGATATTCSDGTCAPTCQANRCSGMTPELGCVGEVGSVEHCLACNDQCDGTNPFCSSEGCGQRFNVTVVNSDTVGSGVGNPKTFKHSLATGSGNQRMVLIAVATGDDSSTATYDGRVLSVAGTEDVDVGKIVVYYLLDADLPSSPGDYTVSVSTPTWAGMMAHVIELKNVDQTTPVADAKTLNDTTDCGEPGPTVTAAPSVSSPGTLLFAAVQAVASNSGAVTSSTIVGGLKQTASAYGGNQAFGLMGYRSNVSSTTTIGWKDLAGSCWEAGLVALSVNPHTIFP